MIRESLPQVLTLFSFTVDSQSSASAISLPSSQMSFWTYAWQVNRSVNNLNPLTTFPYKHYTATNHTFTPYTCTNIHTHMHTHKHTITQTFNRDTNVLAYIYILPIRTVMKWPVGGQAYQVGDNTIIKGRALPDLINSIMVSMMQNWINKSLMVKKAKRPLAQWVVQTRPLGPNMI